MADLHQVRVLDAGVVIAEHQRSFGKGEQIEQEDHINALWLSKPTPNNTAARID